MISDSVRLTSIGVLITAPSMRLAAPRMWSIVGGWGEVVWSIVRATKPSARRKQCYAAVMIRTAIALAAALMPTTVSAETIVENVNGLQIGPDGKLQHFGSFLIADDGRVKQVMANPTPRMSRF